MVDFHAVLWSFLPKFAKGRGFGLPTVIPLISDPKWFRWIGLRVGPYQIAFTVGGQFTATNLDIKALSWKYTGPLLGIYQGRHDYLFPI